MNHINKKFFLFIAVLGVATLSLMSCKKDKKGPSISAAELAVLENLVGTWSLTTVTQDDGPVQVGDYSSLTLIVNGSLSDGSGKTYSVANGGPALPSVTEASWSFVDGSNFGVIEREDGVLMRINSVTATTLVLQQDVEDEIETGGRVASIGRYIYTFTAQ